MQNRIENSDLMNNFNKKPGVSIAFLGPDGSGKSTIISGLLDQELPFAEFKYFHLKPIQQKNEEKNSIVENPHEDPPYSELKSLIKLCFFVFQYNWGWFQNIIPLKRKSTLIIFDRYYDDLLVDPKRYRYGGRKKVAKWVRHLIPKPELYLILTTDAVIIHQRKKEVALQELERQIKGYQALVDHRRYISIDVDRNPEEIVQEIATRLIAYVNERT